MALSSSATGVAPFVNSVICSDDDSRGRLFDIHCGTMTTFTSEFQDNPKLTQSAARP
jgi:hypothetical protein